MANYQLLKVDIDKKVYENTQHKITGESLNSVLNAMVTTLGAEYQFAGVATIDTNPEISDAKVFYIANGKGTYTNFGSLEVTEDEVVVLYYDTEWHKVATGIAADAKLKEAVTELTEIAGKINAKQDIIPDIESIREGAGKGSTALQKESDPVYLADKPSLLREIDGKVSKVEGKGLSSNDFTDAEKLKLAGLENYDDTQVRALIAGKADLLHQHTVADITDFPELYYDATAFFTSGAYPSDRYEELLEAVKAKKTIYSTIDEKGYVSYVFFISSTNSDGSSSRVLLTTFFADGGYLYINTFALQQSGMTSLQESITGKADKATTLAGYGIADAYTKNEVDAAIEGKQDTIPDLDSIREGSALGKTALQEHQDISGLATKEELNGKQDKLVPGDNITIVGNVISSTGGGGGGGGSVDLSAYAKKEEVDAALAGKQDTIADLDAIRQGAQKGSTALQSESDPVYLADKPKLALKVEIPDVSGKVDKVTGKGLSSNDFTDAEKAKLAGLENYDDTEVRRLIEEKQDRMTIDSALSSTSTNPVQNMVVKEALDKKQNALTAGSGIIINESEISTAYKIWHGSQAEYDAIAAKDDMTIYLIEES